jgi:hypothetical protein
MKRTLRWNWAMVCIVVFCGSTSSLVEASSRGYSSQKSPTQREENDSVVVEGKEKQPKLKDAPVPSRTRLSESRFLDSSVSPFALLFDVEKLTGISPAGFDLSFDGAGAIDANLK